MHKITGGCLIGGACVPSGVNKDNPCQKCIGGQTIWTSTSGTCDDGDACTGNGSCSGGACKVGPAELWRYTYGGSDVDEGRDVAVLAGGDVIMVGTAASATLPGGAKGGGQSDAYVARVAANGLVLWGKTYGGALSDGAEAVTVAPDGSVWVAGYARSGGLPGGAADPKDADFWLLHLKDDGSVLASKTYGGSGQDIAQALCVTKAGGLAVLGTTMSYDLPDSGSTAGKSDFWLVRTDKDGVFVGASVYGGDGTDAPHAIAPLGDDLLLFGDTTSSALPGGAVGTTVDAWMLRVDATGKLLWSKTYGGKGFDYGRALVVADGAIVAVGFTQSKDVAAGLPGYGASDAWMLRVGLDGALDWQGAFGGSGDDRFESVAVVPNGGGLLIGGATASADLPSALGAAPAKEDGWLVRIGGPGVVQWGQTFGSVGDERVAAIAVVSAKRVVAVGRSDSPELSKLSPGQGAEDMMLVRADAFGHSDCASSGVCVANGMLSCDDGDDCTADSCDGSKACTHAFLDGQPCDDGDPCTEGESCSSAAGKCAGGQKLSCDDGDLCTDNDACVAGGGCKGDAVAQCASCPLWSKTNAKPSSGSAPMVTRMSDGSAVLLAMESAPSWQARLMRYDAQGKSIWSGSTAYAASDAIFDIIEDPNKPSELIGVGRTYNGTKNYDVALRRWTNSTPAAPVLTDLAGQDEGHVVLHRGQQLAIFGIVGKTSVAGAPQCSAVFVANGDLGKSWHANSGRCADKLRVHGAETYGGGYLVGARMNDPSFGADDSRLLLQRLTNAGEESWAKVIDGDGTTSTVALALLGDDALLLARGALTGGGYGCQLWRYSAAGSLLRKVTLSPEVPVLCEGLVAGVGGFASVYGRATGSGSTLGAWVTTLDGVDREIVATIDKDAPQTYWTDATIEPSTGRLWLAGRDELSARLAYASPFGAMSCVHAGKCGAVTPQQCADGDPCTLDGCDPSSGCTQTPATDGTPCGVGVVCKAGVCQ